MTESKAIARMVRLVGRHVPDRTLFVVLLSDGGGILLLRFTENPMFRRELDRIVGFGLHGAGAVVIEPEPEPRVERCFHFPWHGESRLDDMLCQRIEGALAADPLTLLRSASGIEILPRAIV